MNKKLTLFFILILASVLSGWCAESSWNDMYVDTDTYDLAHPTTEKDFDEALDTIKEYQKTKKVKVKKKAKPQLNVNDPEFKGPKALNGPSHLKTQKQVNILRVEYNLYYENKIIPKGFYSTEFITEDKTEYMLLKQGNKQYAKVKMDTPDEMFCEEEFECFSSKIVDNKYLKIYYKDYKRWLVKYLYILFDDK